MGNSLEIDYRLVDSDQAFSTFLNEIKDEQLLAIDTEFHREGTYFPKAALIQIRWGSEIALIDPLSVDVSGLSVVLDSDSLIVMHAAGQDLEVFMRLCGKFPRKLFDTQIAAGFLGFSNPSLASLHEEELGVRLPKGDRMTDWLLRPLTDNQKNYAASDVRYLLEIFEKQVTQLKELKRLTWVEGECREFLERESTRRDPDKAWLKIKEVRRLSGRAKDIARSVSSWREIKAAELDIPVRRVLPDLAVISISQQAPKDTESLKKVRGLEKHHLRNDAAVEILDAVTQSKNLPELPKVKKLGQQKSNDLKGAVVLISALVNQLARDCRLDPTLLGTRNDIEALISGMENAQMAIGWRAEVVGDVVKDLLAGRISLSFDSDAGILMEPRNLD